MKPSASLQGPREPSYLAAIPFYQRAIELDPNFAPAYGLLALSYWMSSKNAYGHLPDKEAAEKTKVAAVKALAIDDMLAEPHVALGDVLMFQEWDRPGMEREFKRAIQLNPNVGLAHQEYAYWLALIARQGESIREARRCVELDPFSAGAIHTLAAMYYLARQYDQALQHIRKCVEMFPDTVACHVWLGRILEAKGLYDQELAAWQKTMTLSGEKPEDVAALGQAYEVGGIGGAWRWVLEKWKERADREEFAPIVLAARCASLGQKDKALEWLEKAYEEHCDAMYTLKADPTWDPLRSDPRFQDLVRRMNFPS